MKNKAELRSEARAKLEAATPEQSAEWSLAIQRRLEGLLGDGPVLAFWPLGPDEPDLRELIEDRLRAGRPVCLPKVDWVARTMQARVVTDLADLTLGRHKLTEPVAGAAVMDEREIEAVFVPGLAFDASGARLGRGAGFYDRWLSSAAPQARRIGVAFGVQIVDAVPVEAHDVRVDMVVTESGVLTAGSADRR